MVAVSTCCGCCSRFFVVLDMSHAVWTMTALKLKTHPRSLFWDGILGSCLWCLLADGSLFGFASKLLLLGEIFQYMNLFIQLFLLFPVAYLRVKKILCLWLKSKLPFRPRDSAYISTNLCKLIGKKSHTFILIFWLGLSEDSCVVKDGLHQATIAPFSFSSSPLLSSILHFSCEFQTDF